MGVRWFFGAGTPNTYFCSFAERFCVMKSNKYWLKRFEQLQKAQMSKGIGFDRELSEEYEKAIAAVSKEIAYWYERFADNNGISMAAAKRMLNGRELKELRWDVDTYMKNALNAGEKYAKQLENASAKVHIDRLTALKLEMQITANQLAEKTAEGLKATLEDIYQNGYYKTAYEIQKGVGCGCAFGGLDKARIENAVLKPWAKDGKNFSKRVWGDQRAKLVNSLETHLTQAVIRGDSPEKLIKQLTDDFKVARSRASTLVMTESAFFASESSKKSMENLGVEKYEIIGTLDSTACGECGSLDGRVYDMAEYEIGRTAPPFHPNCRCTTAPYIEDEEGMTRIARDKDGKTYDVPADMTYSEWKEKFVDENSVSVIASQSVKDTKETTYEPATLSLSNKSIQDSKNISTKATKTKHEIEMEKLQVQYEEIHNKLEQSKQELVQAYVNKKGMSYEEAQKKVNEIVVKSKEKMHKQRENARKRRKKQNKQISDISKNAIEKLYGVSYNEMKEARIIIKNAELKNGLPIVGKANSIIDKTDDVGNVLQRRIYGNDGKAVIDFDTGNHGLPKRHPTGAHKHVYDYGNKQIRSKPLKLTDEDLVNNNDIIRKGENYNE